MAVTVPLSSASLPAQLAERTRVLNDNAVQRSGEFVLYWMHHAARAHENPALEVAIYAGNTLQLPLLVYQGLGGRHPYNSDRHHTFIMEGAREVQAELGARGISYTFHLARDPQEPSPLQGLARRAALVIVEDFPAPPFPRWTRRIAASVPAPVWAVDCQCVVPMRLLSKAYARAFEFRRVSAALFETRLKAPWEETPFHGLTATPNLGFDAIDLQRTDIAALCAQCKIDHGVGPVRHTPGGARAGYQRWEDFKRVGLKYYHKLRNDAAIARPRGVSGLSAYLHHGQISPFRIAREAAQARGEGAQKFLDELLIWRELAHNFCFHTEALERIEALPSWAQKTLQAHRGDPRPVTYSWESLARGQTGDVLWDVAQKSLLRHGELHNNVRMTWGKAFLNWADSPEEALRLMIDLNHRYALDGNDPNSYGGMLYCLGLFDRPFKPECSIYGTVRPRSTAQHAQRLDLQAYQARVARPPRSNRLHIAVVGAGVSGLSAARSLVDAGYKVTVFDKGRGVGGRMATRRVDNYAFDHGAQYFTVKDARFGRYVESWVKDGVVAPWEASIVQAQAGQLETLDTEATRYVAVPSMSALPRHLASSLEVVCRTRVVAAEFVADKWRLGVESGSDVEPFDAVILALTPQQALPLLAQFQALAKRVQAVQFAPCWSAMVTFEHPLDLGIEGAFVKHSDLAWIARNAGKPGRAPHETWVLHATPTWSANHLEDSPEVVSEALLSAFFESTGAAPVQTHHTDAHRWRYAQALNPL